MHVSSNRPVSEDEKADDVISRRHLYCGTPVVTSWAVAGQQVVFLHMYLQTRVTLEAFPVATPRGRSSSSHEGEPVSIWCDHHLPHTVQHISFAYIWSGCWLWPVEYWSTPLQWLCEVAGYWQELENAVVYADPKYPKHAQWVTCPVSMLAMQELGCVQLPGIVYRSLQHGAMHYHAATWGDGRGWMAQQWASGSRHGISVHSKCHQLNAPVFVVHNICLPIP